MERMALAGVEPLPKIVNNDTPAAERQKAYLEGTCCLSFSYNNLHKIDLDKHNKIKLNWTCIHNTKHRRRRSICDFSHLRCGSFD